MSRLRETEDPGARRDSAGVTALRYSVVRVGEADFAFSDHDRFVAALGYVWDAGLVPEPRPSVTHPELRTMPNLRGVDVDLADLVRSDVERDKRFST
jgi:hypothetical protein